MNEKFYRPFDSEGFVKNLDEDVFQNEFINKLGKTLAFQRLRCNGPYFLTGLEWAVIERGFRALGVPMVLSTSESVELARALTTRAAINSRS